MVSTILSAYLFILQIPQRMQTRQIDIFKAPGYFRGLFPIIGNYSSLEYFPLIHPF